MHGAMAIKIPRLFLARILRAATTAADSLPYQCSLYAQGCSSEIMLKIDYVADCIEGRINLVEITATIWKQKQVI